MNNKFMNILPIFGAVFFSGMLLSTIGCAHDRLDRVAADGVGDGQYSPLLLTRTNKLTAAQEVAASVAIVEVLQRMTRLDELRKETGTVFFYGFSSNIINTVSANIGRQLPEKVSTDIAELDPRTWKDATTGKPAIIVGLVGLVDDDPSLILEIGVKSRLGDGRLCLLELIKLDGDWQVSSFRHGIE